MEYRKLSIEDYHNNYFDLLSQLTNAFTISFDQFSQFIKSLNDNHQVWILIDNNIIIGSATLIIEQKLTHGFKSVGHIEDVIIHSDYRGMNLGSEIVKKLIDISQNSNCYKVILDCNDKKEIFYNKCDMVKTGIQMSKYF
jgi:glucosamine-phosphate N-acetyltransferase